VFLLVPAHPGSPGQRAVKRLLLLLLLLLLLTHYTNIDVVKSNNICYTRSPTTTIHNVNELFSKGQIPLRYLAEAGSKLVADLQRAENWPIVYSLLAAN